MSDKLGLCTCFCEGAGPPRGFCVREGQAPAVGRGDAGGTGLLRLRAVWGARRAEKAAAGRPWSLVLGLGQMQVCVRLSGADSVSPVCEATRPREDAAGIVPKQHPGLQSLGRTYQSSVIEGSIPKCLRRTHRTAVEKLVGGDWGAGGW